MPATEKLIAGYQRFREGYYLENKQYLSQLAKDGQEPKIAIVSCCDSRVEPTIILDCEPGELFVIRNVANLVPPCETNDTYHGTSSALEFAVNGLEVESIIVMGHTRCGGIKALIDDDTSGGFISTWMQQLAQVRENIFANNELTNQAQRYRACEEQGIAQSLENLMSFPWVKSRVEAGTLQLHGWYYDLDSAKLFGLNKETKIFNKIK